MFDPNPTAPFSLSLSLLSLLLLPWVLTPQLRGETFRVPSRCAFSPVPLREPPKVRMWRDERFPEPTASSCPDVEDLHHRSFVRECPDCGKDRHHLRILFAARDDFRADQLLALYDRGPSRHDPKRQVHAIRGRVRIVRRRPDDWMEAELLSAAGFHPHLGWIDSRLEPGRGARYVLSPLNRTRLPNRLFDHLLQGGIWRGMEIGHFACVAPSIPERSLHLRGNRRKGIEHWIAGVWPQQRHFIFRSDRLVAWYPRPGDPSPRTRPAPRPDCLPLWTSHEKRGCKAR